MALNHKTKSVLRAFFLSLVQTRLVDGAAKQINTTICTWEAPRAAIIRDKIYLDGGELFWLPGLDDGSFGQASTFNGAASDVLLTYNLSYSFTSTTNVTGLLVQDLLSKAVGGTGQTDIGSANYVDGALLGNDAEFWFYGGQAVLNLPPFPTKNSIMGYEAFQYGYTSSGFHSGFVPSRTIPGNFSQFVTYGGAARAPSENLAWYFSGATSESGGILVSPTNDTTQPTKISNYLVTLDMSDQLFETWNNETLPSDIKGRASPEVVWVPVGVRGILVALGGVVFPEYATNDASQNPTASESQSPKFMQTIDIYDVASKTWYTQPTTGGPGTRARGCAVLATASDSSSFNIYYYGGYDGIHVADPFHDDVWVLSLPSFTWTQINNGTESHARAGHKCFTPYPDQLMIIGGYPPLTGSIQKPNCLDVGPIVMFNLTSGEWMDSYDPTKYGDYGVPEKVQAVIGGHASGGATATKPAPSGWATAALGKVFATPYDQKKITSYWPYPAAQTASSPAEPAPKPASKSSGLPSWVGPVLGVILGLIALTCVIVLFCLWRRRKSLKNRSSTNTSEENGLRILSWILGQPHSHKAATETTSEVATSPEMREYLQPSHPPPALVSVPEMGDTQLVELPDNTRWELQDTGLSPMDVRERYSHWSPGGSTNDALPSPTRSSLQSTSNIISPLNKDRNSDISHLGGSSGLPSPPLPASDESDKKSLIATPETAITPSGETRDDSPRTSEGREFVVSPPTAEENPGDDYLTAKKPSSSGSPTTRKSVFQEHNDD
ncbi:hypothetical protein HDV63DRAFT_391421 [Trichoderma sp. SZMC 28014]